MNHKFSVIIPLYNKRAEISETLNSVFTQSYPAHEIIIIDDGSTDGSSEVVKQLINNFELQDNHIPVKFITQSNAGECASRNRGMKEATGDWFALLDADDQWEEGYLETIAYLIDKYPNCGAYCTSFSLLSHRGLTHGNTPQQEGVVEDYFRIALMKGKLILTSSTTTISRNVVDMIGSFPEGMKIGGDLYMWFKILTNGWKVAFSPKRMSRINIVASNRSASIYETEKTPYSLRDFWKKGDFYRNEYLAKVELVKAIKISAKGGDEYAHSAEKFYSYNKCSRLAWYKLWILNRLPHRWRTPILRFYDRITWILVKRGF